MLNATRYLLLVLLALGAAACGGQGGGDASGAASGAASDSADSFAFALKGLPEGAADNPIVMRSLRQDPGSPTEYAIIRTNYGDIKLRFFPKQAPVAVSNFKGLAAAGYYDGLTFHRVVPTFMIQGGDPNGDGTGGRSLWGKPFRDEYDPALQFVRGGLVGMANPGMSDANTSQFFITTQETPTLTNKHTLFAEVMTGMAAVDAIVNVPANSQARPLTPVVIEKVIITTD